MKQQAGSIRIGWVIEYKGKPWTVIKTNFVKPGKGGAFMQVEMKAVESEPIVKEEEIVEEYNPTGELKTVKCPECGTEIQMAEGCFICLNCGYSGCS